MDSQELVGIVTVTYNSDKVIDDFLVSILKQSYADFILYVIDNVSSDETLKRLSEYNDPRIVLIQNGTNVGVAEGNNIGIRAALKDGCLSVLLINNDTVFDSDLLDKLADGLEEYQCEMIVPKILLFDKPDTIWCAGGYFSILRGTQGHFGTGCKDDGRFDKVKAVSYSPTCCMLIKSDVFRQVGFMDSSYFVYFDDTDFCRRAQKVGIRLVYLPAVQLRHKVNSLTGSTSNFTIHHYTRNHVYYVLKNLPIWQACFYCPAYYIYIVARYLFVLRNFKSFRVAQKAFWDGISLFNSNLGKSKRTLHPNVFP
jgi:GT2 family glycosyltransferase